MIKKIEIIVSDIDNSLANKGERPAQIAIDALEQAKKKGILVGLATGREITDKVKNLDQEWQLPFSFDFIIGMNGGMIYDKEDDTLFSVPMMKQEEIKDILTYLMPLIKKHKISVNAEGGNNHNAMYIQNELLEVMQRRGVVFNDKTNDIDGFTELPAYKLLFRTTDKIGEDLRSLFLNQYGSHYQAICSFPGTLEIMPKGYDKGAGIMQYAKKKNIPLEHILAFGDNENDNSLLETVGWGVCLKNGADSTKKIANDTTDYTCIEGGIGHYLFNNHLIES